MTKTLDSFDMQFEELHQKKSKKVLTSPTQESTVNDVKANRKDDMATPNKTNNINTKDDGGLLAMALLTHTILITIAGVFMATHAYGRAVIPALLGSMLLIGEAIAIVIYHFTAAHK